MDRKELTIELIMLDLDEQMTDGDIPDLTEEQMRTVAEDMYKNPAFWEEVRAIAQVTIENLGWD